jgi:hypothetical protein
MSDNRDTKPSGRNKMVDTVLKGGFTQHVFFFLNLIDNEENFALARYGDGELAIIQNKDIGKDTQAFNADGWHFDSENYDSVFVEDIRKSLSHQEENYFYGIVCSCCHGKEKVDAYLGMLNTHSITYANVFVNSNFRLFSSYMAQRLNRDVVLVANEMGKDKQYPFSVIDNMWIQDDCVNWYNKNSAEIVEESQSLAGKYSGKLFLISAGPLANILVDKMYSHNPNNCYIDIGSCFDTVTKEQYSRPYQNPNTYFANLVCQF